jgi:acetyl-CoA carboxylase biotin carboxyl carrier protein
LQPFSALCNHARVAERDLTYEDIVQIVDLIKSASHFSEFRLKVGDIEVSLRRADRTLSAPAAVQRNPEPAATADPVRQAPSRSFSDAAHLVRSPMVGTFYRAPVPGEPPFVEVGQLVEPDSIVCIIEVMKLMNSIEAGTRGVVREILVSNGAGVEYGEVLMVIEPGRP